MNLLKLWREHGTKILGFSQITIASIVSVNGVIPEHHLKYWLLSSGLLTAWRGFVNSSNQ